VTGRQFFPHLITSPFHSGLGVAFGFAIAANVIAAIASLLTGRRKPAPGAQEGLGAELAAVAADASGIEPSEVVGTDAEPAPGGRPENGPGAPAGSEGRRRRRS
jgi:hypothetical protein